jgi:hypothetical protein
MIRDLVQQVHFQEWVGTKSPSIVCLDDDVVDVLHESSGKHDRATVVVNWVQPIGDSLEFQGPEDLLVLGVSCPFLRHLRIRLSIAGIPSRRPWRE